MHPQYTRWYPRRVKYHHLVSPEHPREITASYSQAIKFLKNELFSFDEADFSKFCTLYEQRNGPGSRQQVELRFPEWKEGHTRMPGKMVKRILECVPPCLSKEKQFSLLGFQIPSVLHQQKAVLKPGNIYASQLETTYRAMAEKVKGYNFTIEWFLKDMFSRGELKAFTDVFTFTMLDRLRQSLEQVHQDLTLLSGFLPSVDCVVDSRYRISLLGCNVTLDTCPGPLEPGAFSLPPEPVLVTAYKSQYRQMLLEHGLEQRKEKLAGLASRRIALHDVENVVDHLKRMSYSREYETTLHLTGSGGVINLCLQKKEMRHRRCLMALQVFKLVLILGVPAASALLAVKETAMIPFVIVLDFIVIYMALPVWRELRNMKTEVAEYEQKRTKWLAAVRHR